MDTARYLDLFLEESREHLGQSFGLLSEGDGSSLEPDAIRELMRRVHSLKGMAATMGYHSMVELAHALEDLLDGLPDVAPKKWASICG